MKILVAGGAGFLGSHFCDLLLKNSHSVICVDSFITGSRNNLSELTKNSCFKLLEHNIIEPLYVDEKLDAVANLACPASPKDYSIHQIHTMKVGGIGTLNTLGLAKAHNAKYLLTSTSEVYGDPLVHPQKEDYRGNVNPIGIRGVYDEAKRFGEALTMAYRRTYNLDTKIVRIFNTYGPRMRPNDGRAVCNFITKALKNENIEVYGDGKQTRSFCYVTDLVDGLYKLLISDVHEPVNIGNPIEINILQLAEEIIELCQSKSKIVFTDSFPDDPNRRCPDISKAKKLINWEPKILRKDGLVKTIEYFRQILH
ncbi:MAG: SDR family oxidoreductase [Planctomycetes bacterium]|nr:SDR family oxidoreductase [Planctomycetota bacterium]